MPSSKFEPQYTYDDYAQWPGDWELWDGTAVSMTPSPFGSHQKLISKLAHRFISAIEHCGCEGCDVVTELDWIVSADTIVRPDLSIVCGSELQRFIDQPPALIVEVLSESTKLKDRTWKFELYQQQGVTYYLLADPVAKMFEVFELDGGSYRSIPSRTDMQFTLSLRCRIDVHLPF